MMDNLSNASRDRAVSSLFQQNCWDYLSKVGDKSRPPASTRAAPFARWAANNPLEKNLPVIRCEHFELQQRSVTLLDNGLNVGF